MPHNAFRPLDELAHENTVEFQLSSGEIVQGLMIVGITTPASRSFFRWESSKLTMCTPVAWRELWVPTTTRRRKRDCEVAS